MTTHTRRLAVVTLGTIALTLSTTTAGADGPAESQHRLNYTMSLQAVGGGIDCDPTTPSRCIFSFQNVKTYTGDLTGTSYGSGTAALGSDGLYHAVVIERFSGSVNGCGDGTLITRVADDFDLATGEATGSWTIVAHAGTGDLAHASGGSVNGAARDEPVAMIRC
jgi:Protein of unknown function (DUF3224)